MNWKTRIVDPFGGGTAVISQLQRGREECLDARYGRNQDHGEVTTWHCSSNNAAQTYSLRDGGSA